MGFCSACSWKRTMLRHMAGHCTWFRKTLNTHVAITSFGIFEGCSRAHCLSLKGICIAHRYIIKFRHILIQRLSLVLQLFRHEIYTKQTTTGQNQQRWLHLSNCVRWVINHRITVNSSKLHVIEANTAYLDVNRWFSYRPGRSLHGHELQECTDLQFRRYACRFAARWCSQWSCKR